ncbi:MAG: DUF4292 domain-containing protein [Chitinophagaceae bacterium]
MLKALIRKMILPVGICSLLAILLWGCQTTRSLKSIKTLPIPSDTMERKAAPPPPEDTVENHSGMAEKIYSRVMANHISYQTFSAKIKIHYQNDQGKQLDLSAFFRLRKDSIIWVIITAPVVGEVARAIITPDTLRIVDVWNKQVYERNLDFIRQLIHIPLDFGSLQDLIMGNPIYFSDQISHIVPTSSIISFVCHGSGYINHFDVFADDYLLQHSQLLDLDTTLKRSCDLTYGDYESIDGRKFPSERKIFVINKKITQILLHYTRIKFDIPEDFPFQVPRGFKSR